MDRQIDGCTELDRTNGSLATGAPSHPAGLGDVMGSVVCGEISHI